MKVKFIDLNKQYQSIKFDIDLAIENVIKNSLFIGGEEVINFEKNFAEKNDSKFSISCGNGTDALFIAMKSLDLKKGDEVITTCHSWISTSEAISQTGATPIFVDTERDSFCINPNLIEDKITTKTVGIVPVHLYGHPCNMDKITYIANKYNLWIIEDCAQAHLAEFNNKKVGNFGSLSTFSFYPGKNLGAMGDAGSINTNSKELAEWCKLFARHGGKGKHLFEGLNSRMDGIQAAILNIKLNNLNTWTDLRIKNADYYSKNLKNINKLECPSIYPNSKHVYHLYTIKTPFREKLKQYLLSKGIETKINYPEILPFLPAYDYLKNSLDHFPVAKKYNNEILSLPLYPEIDKKSQDYVIENIIDFFKNINLIS